MEEKTKVLGERQKLFIQRERVRRNLIHTKPGETICLGWYEIEILLKWIKELEERTGENGIKKTKA